MEQFWYWSNLDAINVTGGLFDVPEWCNYFEKDLWFDLEKSMWRKHQGNLLDHVKYIHNNIVEPFRVVTLQYYEHVREMQDLAEYLPQPLMKGREYYTAKWTIRDKELYENDI